MLRAVGRDAAHQPDCLRDESETIGIERTVLTTLTTSAEQCRPEAADVEPETEGGGHRAGQLDLETIRDASPSICRR